LTDYRKYTTKQLTHQQYRQKILIGCNRKLL